MNISDRYFLGTFIKTLIISQLAFLVIFVVVDIVGFIDVYIDKQSPVDVVALYYWYYLPFISNLVFPVSMLMAALMTTGQFVRFGELAAMKAAGMSLYRVFAPVLLFALFISALNFWFAESVIPDFQRKKADIRRYQINKTPRRYSLSRNNIYMQDLNNRIVTIGTYNGEDSVAYKINVIEHEKSAIARNINARSMVPLEDGWLLQEVAMRTFDGETEIYTELEELELEDLSFTTSDLDKIQVKPEEMNIFELRDYIGKLKQMGSPHERWIVDFYQKLSFPFANFILVLLGLPLATKSWRGGNAVSFGLCLLICFLYYIIMSFSIALGYQSTIPPHIAPWISNSLFAALGVFSLIKAPK